MFSMVEVEYGLQRTCPKSLHLLGDGLFLLITLCIFVTFPGSVNGQPDTYTNLSGSIAQITLTKQ